GGNDRERRLPLQRYEDAGGAADFGNRDMRAGSPVDQPNQVARFELKKDIYPREGGAQRGQRNETQQGQRVITPIKTVKAAQNDHQQQRIGEKKYFIRKTKEAKQRKVLETQPVNRSIFSEGDDRRGDDQAAQGGYFDNRCVTEPKNNADERRRSHIISHEERRLACKKQLDAARKRAFDTFVENEQIGQAKRMKRP